MVDNKRQNNAQMRVIRARFWFRFMKKRITAPKRTVSTPGRASQAKNIIDRNFPNLFSKINESVAKVTNIRYRREPSAPNKGVKINGFDANKSMPIETKR